MVAVTADSCLKLGDQLANLCNTHAHCRLIICSHPLCVGFLILVMEN